MSEWNPAPETLRNAELIHNVLAGLGRATKAQWREASGLTPGAFDTAKAALDRVLQVHLGQPTTYDPRDWCYSLPSSLDETRPWIVNRLGDSRTRALTIRQTLLASAQAFPEHRAQLEWWSRQLERLADDVEAIAAGLAG